jgi:DNA-binding transcriptional regulator YdaS (Cro superfamily)
MKVFDKVVEKLGSQTALAELCNVTPQAVTKWRMSGFPPKQVRKIEAATGIAASKLCPEVFGPAPAANALDRLRERKSIKAVA